MHRTGQRLRAARAAPPQANPSGEQARVFEPIQDPKQHFFPLSPTEGIFEPPYGPASMVLGFNDNRSDLHGAGTGGGLFVFVL
jgi:hypothetical protein